MNIDKVKDALIAAESLQEKLNEITDSPDTDDGSKFCTNCQSYHPKSQQCFAINDDIPDSPPITDTERIDWLLKKGLAWRDCYDNEWSKGEWLYAVQNGREFIDAAMRRENE
jgi:hypothetical protein